jgi:hypothetical protein
MNDSGQGSSGTSLTAEIAVLPGNTGGKGFLLFAKIRIN